MSVVVAAVILDLMNSAKTGGSRYPVSFITQHTSHSTHRSARPEDVAGLYLVAAKGTMNIIFIIVDTTYSIL